MYVVEMWWFPLGGIGGVFVGCVLVGRGEAGTDSPPIVTTLGPDNAVLGAGPCAKGSNSLPMDR